MKNEQEFNDSLRQIDNSLSAGEVCQNLEEAVNFFVFKPELEEKLLQVLMIVEKATETILDMQEEK